MQNFICNKKLWEKRIDMVGPKVGGEKKKGPNSIIISLIVIFIYLSVRFEWRFAVACICFKFHDTVQWSANSWLILKLQM